MARAKRAGHMPPKMRFLGAQMAAYLKDGLWLDLARRANASARRAGGQPRPRLVVNLPIRSTAMKSSAACRPAPPSACTAAGAAFYPWPDGSHRFVCSWATTENDAEGRRRSNLAHHRSSGNRRIFRTLTTVRKFTDAVSGKSTLFWQSPSRPVGKFCASPGWGSRHAVRQLENSVPGRGRDSGRAPASAVGAARRRRFHNFAPLAAVHGLLNAGDPHLRLLGRADHADRVRVVLHQRRPGLPALPRRPPAAARRRDAKEDARSSATPSPAAPSGA